MDVSIMLDLDGHVTEGPGFNVFAVRGGELFSPPDGILMGITRRRCSSWPPSTGCRVREAQLTAYDLHAADEVFLTSTAGGIMPLVEIDGHPIGDGKPGPCPSASMISTGPSARAAATVRPSFRRAR
jgi:branched-chain amino acid aminotransferase